MSDTQELFKKTRQSLHDKMQSQPWWKYVQPEVKNSISFIIQNIISFGPNFREAFIALSKYERVKRKVQGINEDTPTVLFGEEITEEIYQSGMPAAKSCLDLQDWTEPNEADVQSCLFLCDQISVFEKLGLFSIGSQAFVDKDSLDQYSDFKVRWIDWEI